MSAFHPFQTRAPRGAPLAGSRLAQSQGTQTGPAGRSRGRRAGPGHRSLAQLPWPMTRVADNFGLCLRRSWDVWAECPLSTQCRH